MDVYLLGAGASKSYINPNNNQSMPLAKDFFTTFNRLDISSNPYVLIGDIVCYVRDFHGVTPIKFASYNEDIEIIHSEIHQRLIDLLKKEMPSSSEGRDIDTIFTHRASQQLLFLFNSVINEIQNGDVSKVHVKLINKIKPHDTIITFNWDTLIDRALSETTNWSPDTGYYVKPKAIYDDGWKHPTNDNPKHDTPLLIKLHGSTNWLTGYYSFQNGKLMPNQTSSYDTFYAYKDTKTPYPTYRGRFFPGYQPYSYGYYPVNIPERPLPPPVGRSQFRMFMNYDFRINDAENPFNAGLESMPVIIPPVKQKEYDMFGTLFDTLWQKAEESIVTANRVFIIGYSFPATDIKAHELFRNAFSKRTTMPNVYIINPFPDTVKDIFSFEMGIDTDHLHVQKECFSDSFDFSLFE